MNKLLELAAILLGGTSFFAVCFVGFSAISGTPLNEVPLVRSLVDSPEPGEDEAHEAPTSEESGRHDAPPREPEIAEPSPREELALLATWSLPSPYSAEELGALSDQLKAQRLELDQREAQLALRESGLQEREEQLASESSTLTRMRKELEDYELELATREFEVRRLEQEAEEHRQEGFAQVGGVLSALETPQAGERLGKYTPEEAAQILRGIDEERAIEILNELQGDRWKAYVDAYSKARKASAEKPRK
jgi:hypothetical protein